ncbi:phosphate ABC transporter ATP-binding protein PstB [Desulfocurvibacter africanus]|uniref:phosphate ABC transporter ATP-binding protein PstB n=1 Tax=Desulfocurvibacter africanus TaxID=873 RepID=UPI0003F93784|nr:phosphate ABC transporter ATP-binding protein PstB [Desulfocurvibacter africanus]
MNDHGQAERLPKETIYHHQVSPAGAALEVDRFSLWYGNKQALFDNSLDIQQGLVTALIGPSGCGKSTLIRAMNRMNDLVKGVRVRGEIRLAGRKVYDPGVDVTDLRRRMGMVFQKPNPFPRSILSNVTYPLELTEHPGKPALLEAAEHALRDAGLWNEVKDRLGADALSLSGGQQQRLCIARAIVTKPEILLMDEPCSALDPRATAAVEDLIGALRGRYTVIIVTHNMQQAARVSDNAAFMYLGRIVEHGRTDVVFVRPKASLTQDYITGRFG